MNPLESLFIVLGLLFLGALLGLVVVWYAPGMRTGSNYPKPRRFRLTHEWCDGDEGICRCGEERLRPQLRVEYSCGSLVLSERLCEGCALVYLEGLAE